MLKLPCTIIIGLFLVSSADAQLSAKKQDIEFFREAPSYFLANSKQQKSGNRLIPDPAVTAFLQTSQGRILFSDDGAYFALPNGRTTTQGSPLSMGQDSFTKRDLNLDEKPPVQRVIMKLGIAKTQAQKRNISAKLVAPTQATMNYFVGPKSQWQSNLPSYAKLVYAEVWDGIDLEYRGYRDRLEYALVLKPGATVKAIAMETGAKTIQMTKNGGLEATLHRAKLQLKKPIAFQMIQGKRKSIAVSYQPLTNGTFGFELGAYDKKQILIIEPQLVWSSFLGGPGGIGFEFTTDLALDDSGAIYITGVTATSDFPVTTGIYDPQIYEGRDVFVVKIDPSNSQLIYSMRLGGLEHDYSSAIAVDALGCAYIGGSTKSPGFPTTSGAFAESFPGSSSNAFVTKLNASGTAITFSTFVGGSGYDNSVDMALAPDGHIVLFGATFSQDFPTTPGAYQEAPNIFHGSLFLTKLDNDGSQLLYSTHFGGNRGAIGSALAVDDQGNAYIAGNTKSEFFPTTAGAYETENDQYCKFFISKMNTTGSELIYSTLLDGVGTDWCSYMIGDIAVNAQGQLAIAGRTYSETYPISEGAFDSDFGYGGGFLTLLNAAGSDLIYSTFLNYDGIPGGVFLDDAGFAYLTGGNVGSDFTTTANAFDETYNGKSDAYVTKMNTTGTDLVFSTFLGGEQLEEGVAISLNASGEIYVVGYTYSLDFPTTPNAVANQLNGDFDPFLAKLSSDGSTLLYSTFFGGTGEDIGQAIAVDSSGNVLVAGNTRLLGFPTTIGAFDATHNGESDVVVSAFNPDGSDLVYSTYLGGGGDDHAFGLAVAGSGDIFLTGTTHSALFPTTSNAFDQSLDGTSDAFVARLNSNASNLIYSSFLGGSGPDSGSGIALNDAGNAFVTGLTHSLDFPVSANGFMQTYQGSGDAFVVRVDSLGDSLDYATYLGGSNLDEARDIKVDSANQAFLTGHSASADFPVSSGAFDTTYNGQTDAFVTQLNAPGTGLQHSTFLGGSNEDSAEGIAMDSLGNMVVTGKTHSPDFPTTAGVFEETHQGGSDVFVTKLSQDLSGTLFSTFLGGDGDDVARAVVVDGQDNIFLTGNSQSRSPFKTDAVAKNEVLNLDDEAIFARLSSNGQDRPIWTYIGYGPHGVGMDITLDSARFAYITGYTASYQFPTTAGVFSEESEGFRDIFVAKYDPCDQVRLQYTFPTSQQLCPGEPVTYAVTSTSGEGAMSYQWMKNDQPIAGADQASFTIASVEPMDSGTYSCVVTNLCSSSSTNPTDLIVHAPLNITQVPVSQTVCEYSDVLLTVEVENDYATFQWFRNGVPLTGATNNTFFLPSIPAPNQGSFWCEVSLCETISTEPAILIVEPMYSALSPTSQALGLQPPSFTAELFCSIANVNTQWTSDPPTPLNIQGMTVTLDPVPSTTTTLTVEIGNIHQMTTSQATLLVAADPLYFDVNADGCNNLLDLWALTNQWNQQVPNDPNGDGVMDIRDYLYINLSDGLPCAASSKASLPPPDR